MVMKTPDGRLDAQRMTRGELVYVPPYWAHRTVNIGDEPLSVFCIWPANAGHNYGDKEKEGFPGLADEISHHLAEFSLLRSCLPENRQKIFVDSNIGRIWASSIFDFMKLENS
jgi:Glucose-6-phosphate isomerase (GPI)